MTVSHSTINNNNNFPLLSNEINSSSNSSGVNELNVAIPILKEQSFWFYTGKPNSLSDSKKIMPENFLLEEKSSLEKSLGILISNPNCSQIKSELENILSRDLSRLISFCTKQSIDVLRNQILDTLLKLEVSAINLVLFCMNDRKFVNIIEVAKAFIMFKNNEHIKSPLKFSQKLIDNGSIEKFYEVVDKLGMSKSDRCNAFLHLANKYASLGKVKEAIEAFEKAGHQHTEQKFAIVLITLTENGYWKEASELLINGNYSRGFFQYFIHEGNFPPANCSHELLSLVIKKIDDKYNTALRVILSGLIASGRLDQAVSLVREYELEKEPHNGIKAILNVLKDRGEVEKMTSLEYLLENGEVDRRYYYSCLSEAYTKNREFEKSQEVIENKLTE